MPTTVVSIAFGLDGSRAEDAILADESDEFGGRDASGFDGSFEQPRGAFSIASVEPLIAPRIGDDRKCPCDFELRVRTRGYEIGREDGLDRQRTKCRPRANRREPDAEPGIRSRSDIDDGVRDVARRQLCLLEAVRNCCVQSGSACGSDFDARQEHGSVDARGDGHRLERGLEDQCRDTARSSGHAPRDSVTAATSVFTQRSTSDSSMASIMTRQSFSVPE